MKTKDIQLVNAIPEIEDDYREVVIRAIQNKLITLDEWNQNYKYYRDDVGYSIIHLLECSMRRIEAFVTSNPIILMNKKDLEKRLNVKIFTLEEFIEIVENEDETL